MSATCLRARILALGLLAPIACTADDALTSSSATATTAEPTSSSTTATTTSITTSTSTTTSTTATTTSTATTAGETDTDADTGAEAGWRSELYPEAWTPDDTRPDGRFLHDFSYAGYHRGEAELGADLPALLIDAVRDHGADPSGRSDAGPALQSALDAAALAGGAIITLPAGLYRVDAPLHITASRTVLRGEGPEATRLWFTASQGMSYKSHLTARGQLQLGADRPLLADADSRARTIDLAEGPPFAPGDDIALGWTITDAFIDEHQMTGTWKAFNGEWQPFFWRTVVEVQPLPGGQRLTLDVPLRYPAKLRDGASARPVSGALREIGVEAIGVADATAWDDAWSQDQVHVIELDGVVDAWIRDVASYPSPGAPLEGLGAGRHLQSGGLLIRRSKRVTVADAHLAGAQNRGGGGNGYLFEVRQSSEILLRDSIGEGGRHNFIQNWGFGATGVVWLRVQSKGGVAVALDKTDLGLVGLSEFHHSLATANLIDQSRLDDGWGAVNRGDYSTGAGHAATETVLWNSSGNGVIRSRNFGHGYVIGPAPTLKVETSLEGPDAAGTAPEDWVERSPMPDDPALPLQPASLYEDQLARRLGG